MPRTDFDPTSLTPDDRPATKLRLFDPAVDGPWRGHVAGEALSAGATVLAYGTEEVGAGPGLHVHPYDELFVVLVGRARFFVGDQVIEAEAGEMVLGPAGRPHRFENLGPGRLQTIDIYLSPRWLQADLA